jgi:Bardet-Biedl syndrome 7 protein
MKIPQQLTSHQSEVQIDLLDTKDNAAVVSFTECPPSMNNGDRFLATYHCRAGITRLQLKVRSIEGEHGTASSFHGDANNSIFNEHGH